jgi:hypothetical protein
MASNRRGFLKTLLASAVMGAAISTGLGRTDALKIVESKRMLLDAVDTLSFKDAWTVRQTGGYWISPELVKELHRASVPEIKFKKFTGA